MITLAKAAPRTGLHQSTLRHRCVAGAIPGAELHGKTWLIPEAEVEAIERFRGASPEALWTDEQRTQALAILEERLKPADTLFLVGVPSKGESISIYVLAPPVGNPSPPRDLASLVPISAQVAAALGWRWDAGSHRCVVPFAAAGDVGEWLASQVARAVFPPRESSDAYGIGSRLGWRWL